ncbi:hypothetical protein [Aestuariivirga sp.]|uniref:hypothetical protein n=1 Tax=Aestuariivirga sp. TaxID=2650926 RepID=UPI003784168F
MLSCDDGCERSLVADDLDLVVIDADLLDDGAEIGLAGLDVGSAELVTENQGEGVNALRCQGLGSVCLLSDALERSLCNVTGRFKGSDALLELAVEIHDPVFNCVVEPGQLVGGFPDLGFEGGPAVSDTDVLRCLPVNESLKYDGEPFRRQELFPDGVGHQPV